MDKIVISTQKGRVLNKNRTVSDGNVGAEIQSDFSSELIDICVCYDEEYDTVSPSEFLLGIVLKKIGAPYNNKSTPQSSLRRNKYDYQTIGRQGCYQNDRS